jgi:hypothetical protein
VLLVVPIAIAFAVVARGAGRDPLVDTITFLVIVTVSASLIGLPVAFWLLDHGVRRPTAYVLVGALAAAVPFILMLASAALGITAQIGFESLRWMLARRAVVPIYGSMLWSRFFTETAESMLWGAATALTFWSLRADPRRSAPRAAVTVVILAVLTIAIARLAAIAGH